MMPPLPTLPIQIEDRGIDIRLVQNTRFLHEGVLIDWSMRSDGSLDDSQALATAFIVALGTDHRADQGEELPDPDATDRRGWWGDYDAEEIWGGWPIGCKLWLLKREAILPPEARRGSTIVRVEHYIRSALQPFIRARIGSRVDVTVTKGSKERLDVLIKFYRGPVVETELRFSVLWNDIAR